MTARKPRPLLAVASALTPRADLETIAARAADLSNGILQCREHRRHDWRSQSVKKVGRGYYRLEVCSDCASERWQDLDSRGLVTASGVKYSEGYLNPPGTGRVDATGQGVYRLELLTRLIAGVTEHPAPTEIKAPRKPRKATA
jgi:hypothetical protein